jgi:hypothetical protein
MHSLPSVRPVLDEDEKLEQMVIQDMATHPSWQLDTSMPVSDADEFMQIAD